MGPHPQTPHGGLRDGVAVGAYRVSRLLGQRGLSVVYEALDPGGALVTLKLLRPDLNADLQFRRRFLRQTRAAASVTHSHLIRILDFGEHEGTPYVVQEHIRGEALVDRIRRQGHLPIGETVSVLTGVAGALDAMHHVGLVHREINSGTLLVAEDGTAYISDLGLAKVPRGSVLTRPGQALGSSQYMAPEQIRGEEATPAADVYGLGCVTYECLCGSPPFADRQGMRVLWAHLQDEPVAPSARRPDVPEGMSWAVLRALEKEPLKRPPSATAYARLVDLAVQAARA